MVTRITMYEKFLSPSTNFLRQIVFRPNLQFSLYTVSNSSDRMSFSPKNSSISLDPNVVNSNSKISKENPSFYFAKSPVVQQHNLPSLTLNTERMNTKPLCESSNQIPYPRTVKKQADLMERNGNMINHLDRQITRVLFCGPHFPASHDYTREYLQNHSFIKVDVLPLEDVPKAIADYHMCVVKSMRLDSNIISHAVKMQLIMQYGVGLEGVDIDAATKHGIKVARIPSDATGNSASCAEMAIYLMLGLLRRQNEMRIAIQQKKLGDPIGDTLLGKTVFILGFGNIGIDLAKRLRPFGVNIIATKRSWASHNYDVDGLVDLKGNQEDIYNFAGKADIVVCCLRLNHETAGLIDNNFISSMKKGALLVNIARGGLIDYESVAHHLESGYVGGLGIDVAWTEPFNPDDPILKHKNVIITPHVAGVTEHSYRSMAKVVGDVALQLHAGLPLTGIEFVN